MRAPGQKFEVVPLSDVPRGDVAGNTNPALFKPEKTEPYATGVGDERKHRTGFFCYCKDCELRFPLKQTREFSDECPRDVWLRCPYCGHFDQYTLADLLRASKTQTGRVCRSMQ